MSTRTSIPGSKSGTGSTISTADFNSLPGGLIGKAKVTANQSSITNLTAATGLTLTLTPNASRDIRIVAIVEMSAATSSGEYQIQILKDGTQIARTDVVYAPLSANLAIGGRCEALDESPTNASHTYSVSVGQSGGDVNTWTLVASATVPSSLKIYDDGTTF